jgi:hypothetical protein
MKGRARRVVRTNSSFTRGFVRGHGRRRPDLSISVNDFANGRLDSCGTAPDSHRISLRQWHPVQARAGPTLALALRGAAPVGSESGLLVGVIWVSAWEVWRIDEEDEMSWLLLSLHRMPLVLRPGPIIWRRAAASDVIWRNTVEYRPPRAIFPQPKLRK